MNRLRTGLCVLVALACVQLATAATPRNDAALWRPRFATPALVALDSPANREFVAEVKASAGAREWNASIANDLKSWPCQVVSATFGTINRGTEPGWQVKVRVPADASPELCALTISSSEGTFVQEQAVSVCPAFATDFYILHITDEQIVNDKHTDPTGQYYKMVGTAEEMVWMQEPVNLIHPRMVVITGDQIDYNGALDGWNNWSNWGYTPHGKKVFSKEETLEIENRLTANYKETHRGYHVPYVETPGNHDVPPMNKPLFGSKILWHPIGANIYEAAFGQRSYSFRMGDFYVLMHDWSDPVLKQWAAADYAASEADPTIKYRLIGQHFPEDQAVVPPACDLMLVGHGHTAKTLKTDPYYIYEDGPAFVYGKTGFFNFHRTGNGWSCDQTIAPRDEKKDVWPLFNDNGVTKKVRADQPDSMSLTKTSVTITNDLPEEFYDGRVRFVLPKGTYTAATNGTILAQYDSQDGAKTAVLVKVDIPAKGAVTVSVAPAR